MIAIVAGTRPELIKIAPIYLELKKRGAPVQLWITGQHSSLADAPIQFFNLKVARQWNTLQSGQSSNVLLSKLMLPLDEAISEEQPKAVIVQGDTTSALAGALASFHREIPVAHVEAGLRTGDLAQPFPEEMNRRVIDSFARWHFPPTQISRENLIKEGLKNIEQPTGNTGVDALFLARERIKSQNYWPAHIPLYSKSHHIILSTGHRRENLGEPLLQVLRTMGRHVQANQNTVLYHVAHPNPEALKCAHQALDGLERVHLIPALSYPDFVCLLDQAAVVVTDSGGIQEEAPSFAVKVLITRNVTERPEVLQCGGKLVGNEPRVLLKELEDALHSPLKSRFSTAITPFGDGHASLRIVEKILSDLGMRYLNSV
jgi:UDP-N-acetylglucosamine 2-epimerase